MATTQASLATNGDFFNSLLEREALQVAKFDLAEHRSLMFDWMADAEMNVINRSIARSLDLEVPSLVRGMPTLTCEFESDRPHLGCMITFRDRDGHAVDTYIAIEQIDGVRNYSFNVECSDFEFEFLSFEQMLNRWPEIVDCVNTAFNLVRMQKEEEDDDGL